MSKHTPGPWTLFQDQSVRHYAGIEAGKLSIVAIGYPELIPAMDDSGVHGRTEEEALANALLIAAAPDLLEALEKCLYIIGHPKDEPETLWRTDDELKDAYESAVSAIAKAKGETK
jgi:hypothetical protein